MFSILTVARVQGIQVEVRLEDRTAGRRTAEQFSRGFTLGGQSSVCRILLRTQDGHARLGLFLPCVSPASGGTGPGHGSCWLGSHPGGPHVPAAGFCSCDPSAGRTESEEPIAQSPLPHHVVSGGLRPINLCGFELEADRVLHFLTQRTRPRGFPRKLRVRRCFVLQDSSPPGCSRGARLRLQPSLWACCIPRGREWISIRAQS